MPSFGTEVSHALGQVQATTRLKSFIDNVRHQYREQISDMSGAWNENVLDFSLTSMGLTVKGKLTVEEGLARVAGHLPLAAVMFRGQLEKSIARELGRALG